MFYNFVLARLVEDQLVLFKPGDDLPPSESLPTTTHDGLRRRDGKRSKEFTMTAFSCWVPRRRCQLGAARAGSTPLTSPLRSQTAPVKGSFMSWQVEAPGTNRWFPFPLDCLSSIKEKSKRAKIAQSTIPCDLSEINQQANSLTRKVAENSQKHYNPRPVPHMQ